MDISNLVGGLKVLSAKNAVGIATQGTAAQRLSVLAGVGVVPGTQVIDSVTGQLVDVVSVGVAYLPSGVLNAV